MPHQTINNINNELFFDTLDILFGGCLVGFTLTLNSFNKVFTVKSNIDSFSPFIHEENKYRELCDLILDFYKRNKEIKIVVLSLDDEESTDELNNIKAELKQKVFNDNDLFYEYELNNLFNYFVFASIASNTRTLLGLSSIFGIFNSIETSYKTIEKTTINNVSPLELYVFPLSIDTQTKIEQLQATLKDDKVIIDYLCYSGLISQIETVFGSNRDNNHQVFVSQGMQSTREIQNSESLIQNNFDGSPAEIHKKLVDTTAQDLFVAAQLMTCEGAFDVPFGNSYIELDSGSDVCELFSELARDVFILPKQTQYWIQRFHDYGTFDAALAIIKAYEDTLNDNMIASNIKLREFKASWTRINQDMHRYKKKQWIRELFPYKTLNTNEKQKYDDALLFVEYLLNREKNLVFASNIYGLQNYFITAYMPRIISHIKSGGPEEQKVDRYKEVAVAINQYEKDFMFAYKMGVPINDLLAPDIYNEYGKNIVKIATQNTNTNN